MKQKQLDPHSEFGPTQVKPQTGNKEAQEAAEASRKALAALSIKLRDLPTKKARLLALADAVEKGELALTKNIGFNMGPWYRSARNNKHGKDGVIFEDQTGHACGSVACLAGWISIMDDPDITNPRRRDNIRDRAAEIMGFSDEEANYFFGGDFSPRGLAGISTAAAVAALRDYAKTGKMRTQGFRNDGNRSSRYSR